jgi:peroxiredoxin
MSLRQDIDAFTSEAAKQLPSELLAGVQRSIDDVRKSGIVARALGIGDLVPDFTLPNAQGRPVALADLLRRGPLIISFYRGVWCPYCNLELRAYQRILADIRASGGDFIAISPQTPDNSLSTAEKNALEFEVLSDHRNRIAGEFGIAYETPEVVKRITAMFGTDLAAINGADDWRLPISATYVVDPRRRIVLAGVDPDFRVRLEPGETLSALRNLASDARGKGFIQAPSNARARM